MKPTLRLFSLLLVVAIAGASSIQAQSASVPTWARDQLAVWYKAFNSGDAKAVAALYASDATIMPPGQEPIRGRAAIEAYQRKVHGETKFACSGAFDGFQVVANTAVSWGHEQVHRPRWTPKTGN